MAANDLCTLAAAKAVVETATNASDTLIQTYITAASLEIERAMQRQFSSYGTSTQSFRVDGNVIDLAPMDLRSATTVTIRSPTQASSQVLTALTDYTLQPFNGWPGIGTFTRVMLNINILPAIWMIDFGFAELVINGTWGPASVPVDVADACAKTVASWLDRAWGEYGNTAFNDSGADVRPTRFGGYAIPWSAKMILNKYDRSPGALVV